MNRKTVYFTAPRQVELREESLPVVGAGNVLVETICSAISAGTEMMIYTGRFPRNASTVLNASLEIDSVISSLRGGFKYPLAYGYACAGRVIEAGKGVNREWLNRIVFSFQPHTSHFSTTPDSLFPIPKSLSPETACFLPNMETAVNLVQDAAPILGERVLVLGQGVVGLLTTALLSEFPLGALITADCYELRRKASKEIGITESFDPNEKDFYEHTSRRLRSVTSNQRGADVTFELSGRPETLNDALALTTFSGRIVIGSWYGKKSAEIDLGGAFHRSRIKLISSQVSTIAPELSGRWDKARRFDVAWKALERIEPEKWITHRFLIDNTEKAYHLLDESPQETIQVLLGYNS